MRGPTPCFSTLALQVPFRVGYINGVKGTRHLLHKYFPEDDPAYNNTWFRFTLACAPGVVMTPVVSVLEATNATANPEVCLGEGSGRGHCGCWCGRGHCGSGWGPRSVCGSTA